MSVPGQIPSECHLGVFRKGITKEQMCIITFMFVFISTMFTTLFTTVSITVFTITFLSFVQPIDTHCSHLSLAAIHSLLLPSTHPSHASTLYIHPSPIYLFSFGLLSICPSPLRPSPSARPGDQDVGVGTGQNMPDNSWIERGCLAVSPSIPWRQAGRRQAGLGHAHELQGRQPPATYPPTAICPRTGDRVERSRAERDGVKRSRVERRMGRMCGR